MPTPSSDHVAPLPVAVRRLAAVVAVTGPLAWFVGQAVLAAIPESPGSTALGRIRDHGEPWTWGHLLLGVALVALGVLAACLARLGDGGTLSGLGLVAALAGVVVQAAVLGVDAVLGVLAGLSDQAAATSVHRAVVEQVVVHLDRWDLLLTGGLCLLVVEVRRAGALPVPVTTALLVALALPALADLRVAVAAVTALAFAAAASSLWRGTAAAGPPGAGSTALVAVAFLLAASVSWERAVLGLVVVAALTLRRDRRPVPVSA